MSAPTVIPFDKLPLGDRLRLAEAMTDAQGQPLLEAIKARLPELEASLEKVASHWHGGLAHPPASLVPSASSEDGFYRFYHQSFKVYGVQANTVEIVATLRALLPERALNSWFEQIIREGIGKHFELEDNQRWLAETRPILDAFFHARTMLELAVRYGREFAAAPVSLPSGWAALLYLFDLR